MTDNELKIMSFDLIRHYLRTFENEDTHAERAMYVSGIVDLYTSILKKEQLEQMKVRDECQESR